MIASEGVKAEHGAAPTALNHAQSRALARLERARQQRSSISRGKAEGSAALFARELTSKGAGRLWSQS